jgi:hypothetical protein
LTAVATTEFDLPIATREQEQEQEQQVEELTDLSSPWMRSDLEDSQATGPIPPPTPTERIFQLGTLFVDTVAPRTDTAIEAANLSTATMTTNYDRSPDQAFQSFDPAVHQASTREPSLLSSTKSEQRQQGIRSEQVNGPFFLQKMAVENVPPKRMYFIRTIADSNSSSNNNKQQHIPESQYGNVTAPLNLTVVPVQPPAVRSASPSMVRSASVHLVHSDHPVQQEATEAADNLSTATTTVPVPIAVRIAPTPSVTATVPVPLLKWDLARQPFHVRGRGWRAMTREDYTAAVNMSHGVVELFEWEPVRSWGAPILPFPIAIDQLTTTVPVPATIRVPVPVATIRAATDVTDQAEAALDQPIAPSSTLFATAAPTATVDLNFLRPTQAEQAPKEETADNKAVDLSTATLRSIQSVQLEEEAANRLAATLALYHSIVREEQRKPVDQLTATVHGEAALLDRSTTVSVTKAATGRSTPRPPPLATPGPAPVWNGNGASDRLGEPNCTYCMRTFDTDAIKSHQAMSPIEDRCKKDLRDSPELLFCIPDELNVGTIVNHSIRALEGHFTLCDTEGAFQISQAAPSGTTTLPILQSQVESPLITLLGSMIFAPS